MKKTSYFGNENAISTTTEGLMQMLGCGRQSAIRIGIEAQAKIKIGRRVLWNLSKIKQYLNDNCEV